MTALWVASGVATTGWLLLAAFLPRALRAVPRVDEKAVATATRVSVVVPAHNEAALIRRCVSSIVAQDMTAHEILVVDDHSTDGTREMAEAAGVRVLPAPGRPPGWRGKTWAVWHGAQAATGDFLLFVDADAILAPACLRAFVALAQESGADLVSGMPRPACATFAEALLQPVMCFLILWQFDPRRVNDPRDPAAAAPGGFLLFRRAAYERLGGHLAVRDEIVEDLKLAQLVKQKGMTLRLVAAPHLVVVHRALSLRALLNSWFRVSVDGLGSPPLAAGALFAIMFFFCLPYGLAPLGWIFAVLAAIHLILVHIVRAQLGRAYGLDERWAWLQAFGALLAVLVFLRVFLALILGRRPEQWR